MAYNFTIDTPNPMQGINNALQTYGNVRKIQLAEEQAGMQRQEWQQKQQALAAQQEKGRRYQESLEDLAENPTPQNILRHSALFPEAYEANASLFKSADAEAQKRMTQRASNLTMMLNSGDTEGAMKYIDSLKQAADNSGNKEQSDFFEIAQEMGRKDPNSLQLLSTQMLMSTEDGRKIVEGLADKENVESQIDFREFDKDIKKQELAFKVEQAKYNKAKDERERQIHLAKMDEHQRKIEEAERSKKAGLSNATSSIDNMISTVDKALGFSQDVYDDVLGPISSRLATLGQDEADFEETIELLTNQAFMAQIPNITGMGALSDAEGKKLANSLQTLSLRQSPESMRQSLREIQRLLSKSRKALFEKHGIEETIPDTPYALKTLDDVTLTPESSMDIGALLDQELGLSR